MSTAKRSIVLIATTLILGVGCSSGGTKSIGVVTTQAGSATTSVPTTVAKAAAAPATTTKSATPPTTISAATVAANQMVQAVMAQLATLQQPAAGTNGTTPQLSPSQVLAIVNAANNTVGVTSK